MVRKEPPRTYSAAAQTPIPPLLKLYWIICAGLFLAVIQLWCDSHQQAGFARIQTRLVQADTSSPPAEHPVGELPSSPERRVQTWVREDEPSIEVTGPVFEDPFRELYAQSCPRTASSAEGRTGGIAPVAN